MPPGSVWLPQLPLAPSLIAQECEHAFVTSQGSAYSQFRRALHRRNLLVAWSLAAEIPKVALADALALLLLALDEQPWRFDMAASRWHGRLSTEARLTLEEAQLALAGLHALGGPGAIAGAEALSRLCHRHGLKDSMEALDRWVSRRDQS